MLIGAAFAVVVEGQLPVDSDGTAVSLWALSLGLAFFFLLTSLLVLLQLQRRMGSWMRSKLRSHLNLLRKVMREGVRLDSFLLHECGVPRPGSAALSPGLRKLWQDIDSANDDRPTPETEQDLTAGLAEHLVLLRWVLVKVHEPEHDFRKYQKRDLHFPRLYSRGGLQMGMLALLVNSSVQVHQQVNLLFDQEAPAWMFVAFVAITAVAGVALPRLMNYFLPPLQPGQPVVPAPVAAAPSEGAAAPGKPPPHKAAVPAATATTDHQPPPDSFLSSLWAWMGQGGGGGGGEADHTLAASKRSAYDTASPFVAHHTGPSVDGALDPGHFSAAAWKQQVGQADSTPSLPFRGGDTPAPPPPVPASGTPAHGPSAGAAPPAPPPSSAARQRRVAEYTRSLRQSLGSSRGGLSISGGASVTSSDSSGRVRAPWAAPTGATPFGLTPTEPTPR